MAGKHSASNDRRKKKDKGRKGRRAADVDATLPQWDDLLQPSTAAEPVQPVEALEPFEQPALFDGFEPVAATGTPEPEVPFRETPEGVGADDPFADWREHTAVFEPVQLGAEGWHAISGEADDEPPSNRVLMWLAGTTGVAGVTIAAVFAWLAFGAGIVAPDSDHEVTSKIRDQWAVGSSTIGKDYIGILRIPRFGKTWEFSIARGTTNDVLAHGAGWYEDGAKPGQIGNVVVSAHRVTHNAPFHDFPTLRAGDKVTIETRTRIYTYKLMDDGDATTVTNDTEWPLWDVPDPDTPEAVPTHRLLTLITCAKLFHTDKRLVARAQQVDVDTKATAS